MVSLNDIQIDLVESEGSTFLTGLAGTGKSSVMIARVKRLLEEAPAESIFVIVAEGSQRQRLLESLKKEINGPVGDLSVVTFVRFAREMVTFFWPQIAHKAGFQFEEGLEPAGWLTYDLAQILMLQVVEPMLEEGRFADLRLRPQQIVSQLLDNLNRAALNQMDVSEAIQRQIETWPGDRDHLTHLIDAREAAQRFRTACLSNRLIDLSLAIQLFTRFVQPHPAFVEMMSRVRHLIVDNVEEQTSAGQEFVIDLLEQADTALITLDEGGGYKRFLSADPALAERFSQLCDRTVMLEERFVVSPGAYQISKHLSRFLLGKGDPPDMQLVSESVLGVVEGRYRREMLQRFGAELHAILDREGIEPADVAIIVPYLDGALRFKLTQSLRDVGIPFQLSRRRASPREEPRVRSWLTWLTLAHPEWGVPLSMFDVAEGISLAFHGIDPARARLLAQAVFDPFAAVLNSPDRLTNTQIERIGEEHIARYTEVYDWLQTVSIAIEVEDEANPDARIFRLDEFFYRLFTELLSTPAFVPEPDPQSAAVCDWLIRIATRFQNAAAGLGLHAPADLGRVFIESIYSGIVTASPPDLGDPPDPEGVFIGTIYSFLLSERTAAVQVWLETAATGWWDIPRQPLSNAFVLTESWDPNDVWTLEDDTRIRNELLERIVTGLCARCTKGVVLATSELDRRGARQEGPLWRAFEPLLDPA